jgi:hypothetical protein
MDSLAIWRYVSRLWLPKSRIHSFSVVHSSCFFVTRVCPRLDPLRLHTCLGLARTPAILYDPGCRLHILRCEPRCALHVPALVIRCKSSLSRTASPTLQDACRFARCLSVYLGPGHAPCQSTTSKSAVVTFMAHPRSKPRASPWLVSPLPTRRGSAQACRCGSVAGRWCVAVVLLYVYACCRDGCVHCMCTHLESTGASRYPSTVPSTCLLKPNFPTAFDRTARQAKSQVSAARSVVSLR